MLRSRWLPWVVLSIACTLIGFANAFQAYVAANSFGGSVSWERIFPREVIGWNLWVLFTPVILWLVRRFRRDQDNWLSSLLVYALAGLIFASARAVIPVFIHYFVIFGTAGLDYYLANKYYVFISDVLVGLVVYGLILTFGHALDYHQRYREEELKASRLESQLMHSQLEALRMQLHPHFLFNTLNSISALQMEDTGAAQKMTARLGDFLRLTLENIDTQEVTMNREIEFLNCYLDIERVRFGVRLTTHIEIKPDTLDAQVPYLILQPLVENAIRHGIAAQIARGYISVSATRKQKMLQIQVKDNGPGLKTNRDTSLKEGLGLRNTRARLDQLYGSNYHFDLRNMPEGGVMVTLEIPFSIAQVGTW